MEEKTGVGVVIGRFQTPKLTKAHKFLIYKLFHKHDQVVIFIRISSTNLSKRNPMDFSTIKKMLVKNFPEAIILPLIEQHQDNNWIKTLDSILSWIFPYQNPILYGERDSFISCYTGKFETVEIKSYDPYSATEEREFASKVPLGTQDFRSGVIYGVTNSFPISYQTVDIAVFLKNHPTILLGKRDSEDFWRLPGGFIDPKDKSLEEAASRELKEETGIDVKPFELTYHHSARVNAWGYKGDKSKIMTSVFMGEVGWMISNASDDLDELSWVDFSDISSTFVFTSHRETINKVFKTYFKKLKENF